VTKYVVRRLLLALPMLIGITIVTFTIVNLAPGDPITAMIDPLEMRQMTKEDVEARRTELGLNQPLPLRYLLWLGQAARGNLGYSIQERRPVGEMIVEKLPASMALSVPSIALAMSFGVALGVLSALRQYSAFDYAMTVGAFFGVSVPAFFFAFMGMYVFGVKLAWLPIFGMWTPGLPTTINLDLLRHAIMPVTALVIAHLAAYIRYARAATLDALAGDFVVTARSKGISEAAVLRFHVFRNALLPLVTIAGLSLPGLIAGSFVIETIFSWPGIGLMGYTAILQRDYPLQMGIALLSAVAVLLANLLTDVAYALVDPRIRYD
jgi:peptide/nickel transport system permease protein